METLQETVEESGGFNLPHEAAFFIELREDGKLIQSFDITEEMNKFGAGTFLIQIDTLNINVSMTLLDSSLEEIEGVEELINIGVTSLKPCITEQLAVME